MYNAKDFDTFLSDNSLRPDHIIMHPSVWNGYWSIAKRPRWVSNFFKRLGRLLGSRKIYWIGMSLYWVDGLKTMLPEDIIPIEIDIEDFL